MAGKWKKAREPNTDVSGKPFNKETVKAVWEKAISIPGYGPAVIRKDCCGAEIGFAAYGRTYDKQGWEIDHIKPIAKSGTDDPSNLQPLHWENNRHKGDKYPWDPKKDRKRPQKTILDS